MVMRPIALACFQVSHVVYSVSSSVLFVVKSEQLDFTRQSLTAMQMRAMKYKKYQGSYQHAVVSVSALKPNAEYCFIMTAAEWS